MGTHSEDKIERWVEAATPSGEESPPQQIVIRAAEFLERTIQLSEDDACRCLSAIDFSHAITVVRLPTSIYVQLEDEHLGLWYTDTGLSPDIAQQVRGRQTRKLFIPHGNVPALKSKPRSGPESWGFDQVFQSVPPDVKANVNQPSRGGGMQYVVYSPRNMRPLA